MKPNAPVRYELVNAGRCVGAVDANAWKAQTDPILTQRIFWGGRNVCQHGFSSSAHFFLNRRRHVPCRVLLFSHDFKISNRCLPVRPSGGDWTATSNLAVIEIEQHALGNIDDDISP